MNPYDLSPWVWLSLGIAAFVVGGWLVSLARVGSEADRESARQMRERE